MSEKRILGTLGYLIGTAKTQDTVIINTDEIEALENLIKRYQELSKKNMIIDELKEWLYVKSEFNTDTQTIEETIKEVVDKVKELEETNK